MFEARNEEWIPWFVDIYVPNPKKLQQFLKKYNIGSRFVYPRITSQEAYSQYKNTHHPVSEMLGNTGLWLPSSTVLTDEQIDYICEKVIEFTDNED
jgi:perosamine synthetase